MPRTPSAKAAVRKNATERLQFDTINEPTEGEPFSIELVPGTTVRVLPARMWRISALAALKEGDFDTWAKKSLATIADYDQFTAADPTLEDFEKFMKRLGEATDPGN